MFLICRQNASDASIYRCRPSLVDGIAIANATISQAASLIANGLGAAISERPPLQPAPVRRRPRCVPSRLTFPTGLITVSRVDSYS